MDKYDAIVVGAGNGGMSAACGLARGGLKTLLLERHNLPGGCATSFRRGDFEYECSLHHLSGCGTKSNPGPFYHVLDEIGVIDKVKFLELPNIMRIIVPGRYDFSLHTGRDNVIASLKKEFPEESEAIDAFFDMAWKCWEEYLAMWQFNFDSVDVYEKLDPDASPEKYPTFYKYAFQNASDVMSTFFKNPILKTAVAFIGQYAGPISEVEFLDVLYWQYYYIEHMPLHIQGNSQALSNAMVERFLADGGEIRYNCNVKKILAEQGAVVGVQTEDGTEYRTNIVVSDISPMLVCRNMIDPQQIPPNALEYFKDEPEPRLVFSVFIGLDCPCDKLGITDSNIWTINPPKPELMTITTRDTVDPREDGKSEIDIVTLYGISPQDWLMTPPNQYHQKKFELAETVLQKVEELFPGVREHIEEIEIASPLTNVRYTSTPGGSMAAVKRYYRGYLLFPEKQENLLKGLYEVASGTRAAGGFQPVITYGWTLGKSIAESVQATR